MASPRQSGMLTGGGCKIYRSRRHVVRKRRLRHFPDVHITDSYSIKNIIPPFDPRYEFEYSQRELHLLAEKLILEDPKPRDEYPCVLSMASLRTRQRREIQVANGTPDPSVLQGIYFRSHPDGRRVRAPEQRAKGASFYGR